MTLTAPTRIEHDVMEMLLTGEHDILNILRKQFALSTIVNREFTGAGFYSTFSVPEITEQLPNKDSFCFGDVDADISGLKHVAGFLLWIREGVLDFLEGYTHGEPWPDHIDAFTLQYHHTPRDIQAVLGR